MTIHLGVRNLLRITFSSESEEAMLAELAKACLPEKKNMLFFEKI